MPDYRGTKCPVCEKEFQKDDDIIVCPVCGTPHHRDCYKSLGHCANEPRHAAKFVWTPGRPEAGEEMVSCRRCGTPNPAGNRFCHHCGTKLESSEPQQFQRPAEPEAPAPDPRYYFLGGQIDYSEELEQGVTVKECCDYLGPNNLRMLMKMKAIARQQGLFSVNFSAFFFHFIYCFYRKMYKLGFILMAIMMLTMIPTVYFSYLTLQDIITATGTLSFPLEFVTSGPGFTGLMQVSFIVRFINFAAMLFCGLFFNKMYYKKMIQDIVNARENGHFTSGSSEYYSALSRIGGVNRQAPLFCVTAVVVLYIAVGYIASSFLIL